MKNKITIELLDSGFVVEYPNPESEGTLKEAIEYYKDDTKEECEAVKRMLDKILNEAFVKPYSKHNEWNVVVDVEHTNNYEKQNN